MECDGILAQQFAVIQHHQSALNESNMLNQFDQLTRTYQRISKFKIQDLANNRFQMSFSQTTDDPFASGPLPLKTTTSTASTASSASMPMLSSESSQIMMCSSFTPSTPAAIWNNNLTLNTLIQEFRQLNTYTQSLIALQNFTLNSGKGGKNQQSRMLPFQQRIGSGAQGVVSLKFLETAQPNPAVIPLASKRISESEQFMREVLVLNSIHGRSRPIIANIDKSAQTIDMELCVCTLEKLKEYLHAKLLGTDELYASILAMLLCGVFDLMQYQHFFHGDIKPQNVALAQRNDDGQLKVVFLDFGASSSEPSDYMNSFTPAYVSPAIFRIVNVEQRTLSLDEIRFAECYSCCRAVQAMIIPHQNMSTYFTQKNTSPTPFLEQSAIMYPKTTKIMKKFFQTNKTSITVVEFVEFLTENSTLFKSSLSINQQDLYNHVSPFHNTTIFTPQ